MLKIKNKNTESEILNAAKHIFQLKGMNGTRMQEIADKAGINKAMLHYYFRSKDLLFRSVFMDAFASLAPQLNNILNSEKNIFDKIIDFSNNYISFIILHPYLPNFIIQEMNRNAEFVQKLISDKNFPSIKKFKKQVQLNIVQDLIRPITAEQLFINIMALNIFPFVASPLLKGILKVSDAEYNLLIDQRKTEVAEFIINAIKIKEQ
jgi:AcrR family transcriptional regulator